MEFIFLNKEILEIEKLEKSVYNKTAVVFEKKTVGNYVVTTGFEWNTLDDLRFGKKHNKDWCYIQGEGMSYDFDRPDYNQDTNLKVLGITKSEAINKYKKYCTN